MANDGNCFMRKNRENFEEKYSIFVVFNEVEQNNSNCCSLTASSLFFNPSLSIGLLPQVAVDHVAVVVLDFQPEHSQAHHVDRAIAVTAVVVPRAAHDILALVLVLGLHESLARMALHHAGIHNRLGVHDILAVPALREDRVDMALGPR